MQPDRATRAARALIVCAVLTGLGVGLAVLAALGFTANLGLVLVPVLAIGFGAACCALLLVMGPTPGRIVGAIGLAFGVLTIVVATVLIFSVAIVPSQSQPGFDVKWIVSLSEVLSGLGPVVGVTVAAVAAGVAVRVFRDPSGASGDDDGRWSSRVLLIGGVVDLVLWAATIVPIALQYMVPGLWFKEGAKVIVIPSTNYYLGLWFSSNQLAGLNVATACAASTLALCVVLSLSVRSPSRIAVLGIGWAIASLLLNSAGGSSLGAPFPVIFDVGVVAVPLASILAAAIGMRLGREGGVSSAVTSGEAAAAA